MFLKCLGFCGSMSRNSTQKQYPTIIEELCHQFSLADLRKSTNNFDESREIGRGAFSVVYKGCHQRNDGFVYTVALKRFNVKHSALFKKEIELLCQIRHPNIVSLIGFCNNEKEKIIVYEYMSNGSLDGHLQLGELSWKKRLEICIGVARGLHYLHAGAKRSIFHCILTTSGILLDDNMEPKLTGFSLSVQGPRFMSKPKPIQLDPVMDALGFMAREYVITDSFITDKWDVFSFGTVLLQVVCGGNYLIHPREIEFLEKPVEEKIDLNIRGKIAPQCWQLFIDIMVNCLKYEADERPTMGEVEVQLEHALSLQEQSDSTNTNGDYTILSSSSESQRQYPTVIEELCPPFSLAYLRKSTNYFALSKIIGKGEYSTVYKGCLQQNDASDCTVAVKRYDEGNTAAGEEFKNEIELLCQLRHPNIVSLIGFCNDEKEKIIVYEYMSNGSLDQHIERGDLSWKKRLEICIGVARGLHYLHAGAKRTIIHRHVKPSNILLDDNMHPKLVDFGFSIKGARFMSKPKPIQVDRIVGTFGYMARECVMDGTVTDKTDVFSFGVVLLDLVWGNPYYNLLRSTTGTEFLDKPVEENIDPNVKGKIAPECWEIFIDIIIRCVKDEPDERPTMGEVEVELEHALCLQEQADITNTNTHYILLSKTNPNMVFILNGIKNSLYNFGHNHKLAIEA
ncbi:Receptor-like protein kinase ANXUR2, partial [Mucuna pruriens]